MPLMAHILEAGHPCTTQVHKINKQQENPKTVSIRKINSKTKWVYLHIALQQRSSALCRHAAITVAVHSTDIALH